METKYYAGMCLACIRFPTRREAREWARKHPQGRKPRGYPFKIVYGPLEKEEATKDHKPASPWSFQVWEAIPAKN